MFAIAKFRTIDRKRAGAAAKLAHVNDNHPVARLTPAVSGRTALVGRWRKHEQTGRLEWHWSIEDVSEETEAPLSPPWALRAGHTPMVLKAKSGAEGPSCHPTDTQLDVVQRSAKATLIFARN